MAKRVVVFPGTFDPITHGHLDVIRRGARLFDELVVGVSQGSQKNPMLTVEERRDLICELVTEVGNVRVEIFAGMTVEFVRQVGAEAILRGIRTHGDFEYELQLALANRQIGGVETVFVMASAENAFVRSTLIKEAIKLNADISPFVPPVVADRLRHRLAGADGSVGLGGQETPDREADSGSLEAGEALN